PARPGGWIDSWGHLGNGTIKPNPGVELAGRIQGIHVAAPQPATQVGTGERGVERLLELDQVIRGTDFTGPPQSLQEIGARRDVRARTLRPAIPRIAYGGIRPGGSLSARAQFQLDLPLFRSGR